MIWHTKHANLIASTVVLHQESVSIQNMGIKIPDRRNRINKPHRYRKGIKPTMQMPGQGPWRPTRKWGKPPQVETRFPLQPKKIRKNQRRLQHPGKLDKHLIVNQLLLTILFQKSEKSDNIRVLFTLEIRTFLNMAEYYLHPRRIHWKCRQSTG